MGHALRRWQRRTGRGTLRRSVRGLVGVALFALPLMGLAAATSPPRLAQAASVDDANGGRDRAATASHAPDYREVRPPPGPRRGVVSVPSWVVVIVGSAVTLGALATLVVQVRRRRR